MTLDIDIEADGEWDSSTDWRALAHGAARSAIAESAFPDLADSSRSIELSVILTGDAQVHALNSKWRGKDKATNILSFPQLEQRELEAIGDEGPEVLLGDLVLAHGVCAREAEEKRIPVERHAAHLLVHGTLHLLGYDHQNDADAEEMERREVRALARLGIADPYAVTH